MSPAAPSVSVSRAKVRRPAVTANTQVVASCALSSSLPLPKVPTCSVPVELFTVSRSRITPVHGSHDVSPPMRLPIETAPLTSIRPSVGASMMIEACCSNVPPSWWYELTAATAVRANSFAERPSNSSALRLSTLVDELTVNGAPAELTPAAGPLPLFVAVSAGPLPLFVAATPVPESLSPLTPMPDGAWPKRPQPPPACEPHTPTPKLPVPLLIPRTPAEKPPGLVGTTFPRTPAAAPAVESVSPSTPGPVPKAASWRPKIPVPLTLVPRTPVPEPACEPSTPLPFPFVPAFWPLTAAEPLPGAGEVSRPKTPNAFGAVDAVSPRTPAVVPVLLECVPTT